MKKFLIKTAQFTIICGVATLFVYALFIGMDREVARREIQTQVNCEHYGAAMNNWARQKNLPVPCAE